jgi:hypothetical protein
VPHQVARSCVLPEGRNQRGRSETKRRRCGGCGGGYPRFESWGCLWRGLALLQGQAHLPVSTQLRRGLLICWGSCRLLVGGRGGCRLLLGSACDERGDEGGGCTLLGHSFISLWPDIHEETTAIARTVMARFGITCEPPKVPHPEPVTIERNGATLVIRTRLFLKAAFSDTRDFLYSKTCMQLQMQTL